MTQSFESTPEVVLQQLVEEVGRQLGADRCFLYVRQPHLGQGRIAFCWRRTDEVPDVIQPNWQEDTNQLPEEDPLFAAAIHLQPSVFVDDVEQESPAVLNRTYEAGTFGHRALIHAHVREGGQLWGILQPAVFDRPRHWSEEERAWVESLLPSLVQPIRDFVNTEG